MLIYESGMSDQEHVACLMEVVGDRQYSLNVQVQLIPADIKLVQVYQQRIQQYYESKKGRYCPLAGGTLHVSLTKPFPGSELLKSNIARTLQSFQHQLTLDYADTNSDGDGNYLFIEFNGGEEWRNYLSQISTAFDQFRAIRRRVDEPHLTIGRHCPDTPDQIVTANPGFKSLRFHDLVVTLINRSQ